MGNKAMEGDNDMLIIVVTYAQCTSGMFCVWNILVNLLSSIERLRMDVIGESGGCTPTIEGLHLGSLFGAPYGCARPPMHISGGSRGDS